MFQSVSARDAANGDHPSWFDTCDVATWPGREDRPYCFVDNSFLYPENAEALCEMRSALANVEWVCKPLELT